MKKPLLLITLPFMFFITLSAQITQEQADTIVQERITNETRPFTLYAEDIVQTDYTVLTSANEKIKLNYPCWVYYVSFSGETDGKYLIVKESNGNVMEVNAKNDEGPEDLEDWRVVPFLQYSLWECTGNNYFIEMKIFPSIHMLKIRTVPNVLGNNHTMPGTFPESIEYMIQDNKMYWKDNNGQFILYWKVTYFSDNEIILELGSPPLWPPNLIISYHFICQTEFCEI